MIHLQLLTVLKNDGSDSVVIAFRKPPKTVSATFPNTKILKWAHPFCYIFHKNTISVEHFNF